MTVSTRHRTEARSNREAAGNTASLGEIKLPLACYRFRLRARETMRLPDYSGSAWRGAFGNSLKKLVCITREPQCEPCLLYRNCIYPYVFETPPDPSTGKLRKYNAAPHPFVLRPGTTLRGYLHPDTEHNLYLTLFGRGNNHLPYIIHALERATQRGLGKHKGKFDLLELQQYQADDWRGVYTPGGELQHHAATYVDTPDCPARMTLEFFTPMRCKTEGHLVTPERFTFKTLFSSLLRRLSLLTTFHTDTPLATDFKGLTQAAGEIPTAHSELRWHDWTRYSSRQDTLMQLGGLSGTVSFESSELAVFWPYLWLGQWTHAGKNTSMGLGKYKITNRY